MLARGSANPMPPPNPRCPKASQHQLEDRDRLLELQGLPGDRVGVQKGLDDPDERIGHGVRVDRKLEGAASDLLRQG
jgi:hypothetical protein